MKYLALIMFLVSVQAMACPQLAGDWKLNWSSEREMDPQMKIEQKELTPGVFHYQVKSQTTDGNEIIDHFISDGEVREVEDSNGLITKTSATCNNDNLVISFKVYWENKLFAEGITHMQQKDGKVYLSSHDPNKPEPVLYAIYGK